MDQVTTMPVAEENRSLTHDIRTAAALVREGDWRGFVWHFEGHDYLPLALLAEAVGSALYSFPVNQIGPDQIISLSPPNARDVVADWLAIFGCRS